MKIPKRKVKGNRPQNGENPVVFIVLRPNLLRFLSSGTFWLKFVILRLKIGKVEQVKAGI